MLYYSMIQEFQIKYLNATEPFSLTELYEFQATIGTRAPAGPALFDLKNIAVESLQMPDIRRLLIQKGSIGPTVTNISCVYVVNGTAAAAVIKAGLDFAAQTWSQHSLETLITEDFTEAASWLATILNKNKFDVYRAIDKEMAPLNVSRIDK